MYIQCIDMFMIRNVYTWYKHVYTFTRLYIHVYTMYIQSCICIDMCMAGLSPSMRLTLHKHVYTLYIHVYAIWSGFQMKPQTFAVSTLLYEHTNFAFWQALLTPTVVNSRKNQISIGISQPLKPITSCY